MRSIFKLRPRRPAGGPDLPAIPGAARIRSGPIRAAGRNRFTLVELLVALAVSTLVLGVAAYGLGLTATLLKDLDLPAAEEARALGGLRDSLGGAIYYVGERERLASQEQLYYYFYAAPAELRYISAKSFSGGAPVICRVWVDQERLVIDEYPLYDAAVDFKYPALPAAGRRRKVLLERVKSFAVECQVAGRRVKNVSETMPELVRLRLDWGKGERLLAAAVRCDCRQRREWAARLFHPEAN